MSKPTAARTERRRELSGSAAFRPSPPSDRAALGAMLAASVERHKRGELAAAERGYRDILARSPEQADALHLLGVTRLQQGDAAGAVPLIERAIARNPDSTDYHANLGAALQKLERPEEAEAAYRRALALNPRQLQTLTNLAQIHEKSGKIDEAVECCRRAVEIEPGLAKAYHKAVDLLLAGKRYGEAAAWLERLVERWPDEAGAHSNLGYAYEKLGDDARAEPRYRRAVALKPEAPEFLNNLAVLLRRQGRLEEAKPYFSQAMALSPESWESDLHRAGWLANLGDLAGAAAILLPRVEADDTDVKTLGYLVSVLGRLGRFTESARWGVRLTELDPENAEAWCLLGAARFGMKDQIGGEAAFRKAIALKPDYVDAHVNLLEILDVQNRHDEATMRSRLIQQLPGFGPEVMVFPYKAFRGSCDFESIERMGDIWQSANAALGRGHLPVAFLHLLVEAGTVERARELTKLHRAWAERTESLAEGEAMPAIVPARRAGRLRVALLSSDLRKHSVAKFVLPLLRSYDRERLEIVAYSTQAAPGDPVQAEIRGLVDRFVDLEIETNRALAELARGDGIEALVELNGFTAGSRIGALTLRLAPIQLCWLGYPYTTGFKEIDYILVDPHVKPTVPELFVERPLVMPHSWLCFEGYQEVPIDPVPPCERNGYVTFGTFNNPYKFTRQSVAAWSDVLHAVPGSRFLLVRPAGQSRLLAENLIKAFGRHGIAPERLFILANQPTRHLELYNQLDVALDTFPVTGGTTTCDALWMGVPTVSLRGAGMHQRVSHSILMQVNLGEISTESVADYVRIATALAGDTGSLRLLRRTLREAAKNSPLFRGDVFAAGFCEAIETAAREKGLR